MKRCHEDLNKFSTSRQKNITTQLRESFSFSSRDVSETKSLKSLGSSSLPSTSTTVEQQPVTIEEESGEEDIDEVVQMMLEDEYTQQFMEKYFDEDLPADDSQDYECGSPQNPEKNNYDKNVIIMSLFILRNNLNKTVAVRMENLFSHLYGFPNKHLVEDALKMMKEVYNEIFIEKDSRCVECAGEIEENQEQCKNIKCKNYETPIKTGTTTEASTTMNYNIKMQIYNSINNFMPSIVAHHRVVHQNDDESITGNETKQSRAYKSIIETKEEFLNRRMVLPYTLSFDGAHFAKVSKSEYTPLFLKLECLPMKEYDPFRLVLCALHKCSNGATIPLVANFLARTVSQLKELQNEYEIEFNGELWRISHKCLTVVCDSKANLQSTGLPNWKSIMGCMKCVTVGEKCGKGVSYNQLGRADLRTDSSCLIDATRKQNGFTRKKVPIIFDILTPNNFTIDYFHCVPEGVIKDMLTKLLESSSDEWSSCITGRAEAVVNAVERATSHTACRKIKNLTNRTNITGSEMELMGFVAIILSSVNIVHKNVSYSLQNLCIMVLIWHKTDKRKLELIRKCLDFAKELHVLFDKTTITMKSHMMYDHIIDSIWTYGLESDTRPFERLHSQLQNSVHYRATNNLTEIPLRFVARCHLESLFDKIQFDGVEQQNLKKMGMMPADPELESLWSSINSKDIEQRHITFLADCDVSASDCTFFSRWKKMNSSNTFSSPIYWKKSRKSDGSLFYGFDKKRNTHFFAQCELFFETSGREYCLVKRFEATNPFEKLERRLHKLNKDELRHKEVIEKTYNCIINAELPIAIHKSAFFDIIPTSCFNSPAASIKCENETFYIAVF